MRLITYDFENFAYDWVVVFKDKETGQYIVIHNDNEALKMVLDDDWATHSIEYFIGGDIVHNEGGQMIDCISFTLSKENRSKTN